VLGTVTLEFVEINSPISPTAKVYAVVLAFCGIVRKLPPASFTVVPLNVVAFTVVAVITAAVKLPEASRATIVEAPLAEAAVVQALSRVPLDTAVAFKLVMFAPENVAEFEPVPPLATGKTPDTLLCKLA